MRGDIIVSLKTIFKAVCEGLTEATGIATIDSDLAEPVEEPCFKVFMNTKAGLFSQAIRQVKVYFDIYYYAKNEKDCKAEMMDIEDRLSFYFAEVPFEIKEGCAVFIDEVEFERLPKGILNISFDFEIGTEYLDESDAETMETLKLRM